MKRSKLAAVIGSALLLGSSAAYAGDPPDPNPNSEGSAPNLNLDEKLLFVVVETAGSIVASIVEHTFVCSLDTSLSGSTNTFGRTAAAKAHDYNLAAATVAHDAGLGTVISTADGTNAAGDGNIGNTVVSNLAGTWYFSPSGEILQGGHDVNLDVTQWDEHVIKDIFVNPNAPGGALTNRRVILDRGLEVITKKLTFTPGGTHGIPRSKWRQTSRYVEPDGGLGELTFKKARVAPNGAVGCLILATLQNLQRDGVGFKSGAGSKLTATAMGQIVPNP